MKVDLILGQECNHRNDEAKEEEGKENRSADFILLRFGIVVV